MVAIVGRPSSGKSTFLNTASGEKVSIVSPIPQTTRNAVRGIVNTSYGQLVFVDTPGYHNSEKKLNMKLRTVAEEQLKDADLILYIIDSTRKPAEEETLLADLISAFREKTIIGINKIDLPESNPIAVRLFLEKFFPQIPKERIIEFSAEKDKNINDILLQLYNLAPEAEPLYPEEFYTDQEVDFRIAEIIREKAMNSLFDEIPHALYVEFQIWNGAKAAKNFGYALLLLLKEKVKKV